LVRGSDNVSEQEASPNRGDFKMKSRKRASKDGDQAISPETSAWDKLGPSVTDHDMIRDPKYENDPLFKGMYRGGIGQAIAVRHWKGGKSAKHIIDCDADPFIPEELEVEKHIKDGQLEFDLSQIELYLDKGQKNGKSVAGNKLRELLVGKPTLNANVLDYLLAHPKLIPEEWKDKFVFFWGTIYRRDGDLMFVRCLCWHDGRWGWHWHCLGLDFQDSYPAALRKAT
jgi:hypothetical protein